MGGGVKGRVRWPSFVVNIIIIIKCNTALKEVVDTVSIELRNQEEK